MHSGKLGVRQKASKFDIVVEGNILELTRLEN
jgi:hypothetical protein